MANPPEGALVMGVVRPMRLSHFQKVPLGLRSQPLRIGRFGGLGVGVEVPAVHAGWEFWNLGVGVEVPAVPAGWEWGWNRLNGKFLTRPGLAILHNPSGVMQLNLPLQVGGLEFGVWGLEFMFWGSGFGVAGVKGAGLRDEGTGRKGWTLRLAL